MKIKCHIKLFVLVLFLVGQSAWAGEWYVSPDGKATNTGAKDSPWDIASALDGSQKVGAGDTIYLLAGTYRRRPQELFEIRLVGSADAPIQIRPLSGKRVTPRQQHSGARIDGGLSVQNPSANLWVRDLEIFVSEPLPEKPVSPGSSPEDLKRPWGGLHTHGGKDCKYINLVIHNSALSKKQVIKRPVLIAYKTGVQFFDFYGYGQKFQKMFSSKPPDEGNRTCQHATDGGIGHPRDYRCGHKQPMFSVPRPTTQQVYEPTYSSGTLQHWQNNYEPVADQHLQSL